MCTGRRLLREGPASPQPETRQKNEKFRATIYRVINRLTSDVRTPFRLDPEMNRIDDTPVHKSLREALANALIHADYYGRSSLPLRNGSSRELPRVHDR